MANIIIVQAKMNGSEKDFKVANKTTQLCTKIKRVISLFNEF